MVHKIAFPIFHLSLSFSELVSIPPTSPILLIVFGVCESSVTVIPPSNVINVLLLILIYTCALVTDTINTNSMVIRFFISQIYTLNIGYANLLLLIKIFHPCGVVKYCNFLPITVYLLLYTNLL